MRAALAVVLVFAACVDSEQPDEDLAPSEDGLDPKSDNWNQPCRPIGDYATFYVTELAALWKRQPAYLCAYDQPTGESACGKHVANNAFFCPADNGISWHIPFFTGSARFGAFAPAVILAHEWGHMNQFAYGLSGHRNVTRTVKQNEQHADCQAGIFIAAHQMAWGAFAVGPIYEAYATLCSGATPDSQWWDPRGHGSCIERATAFAWGYQQALAYAQALAYDANYTMLSICSIY